MAAHLWFIMALGAAVAWGAAYTFLDKLMRSGIEPGLSLLIITAAQAVFMLGLVYLRGGFSAPQIALLGTPAVLYTVMFCAGAFVLGNMLVFHSIQLKDAVLVNLIEITYPIFTFFFAWLIFKEVTLNWATGFGALLIISGVGIILVKS